MYDALQRDCVLVKNSSFTSNIAGDGELVEMLLLLVSDPRALSTMLQ